jgi:predicted enzyme related to lactoylglutathione lyase
MGRQSIRIRRSNTVHYCQRWRETVSFYRDLMGLPVSFENDWFVEFRLGAGAYMSIADASRGSIQAVEGQGVTITWEVANLPATRATVQASGIVATPIARRWGADVFHCYDPEGHRLEFWADAG